MSIFKFTKQKPVLSPPPDPAKLRWSQVRGFSELVGQTECIRRLKAFGDLYASTNSAPEHLLLVGEDGMGKARIAQAFAKTYNTGLHEHSAKEFKKPYDLTAKLTSLESNEAFVISEVQDLRKDLEDLLCLAIREFRVDLIIGQGLGKRVHPYQLTRFTCIATAPRLADVPPDLRKCFSLSLSLQPYTTLELESIALDLAKQNGLNLVKGAGNLVATVAQGNPGMVEQLIRRLSRLGRTDITEAETTRVLATFGLKPHDVASIGNLVNSADLDKLTGIEFEKLITGLLQQMGFHAEMTRATGDGGIDIVAHLEKAFIGGRYLIQCKRFSPDVLIGAPMLREFYGAFVADRKAIKGVFITTSAFTAQAHEFAQTLPIELIDGIKLKQLLAEHGSKDGGSLFV